MEVRSLPVAECLTFRNHSSGDTLDAFTPLAQYTQRNHAGMTRSAWTKIFSSFTLPDGTVLEKTRVKELEIVPEWAGHMTVKSNDPV